MYFKDNTREVFQSLVDHIDALLALYMELIDKEFLSYRQAKRVLVRRGCRRVLRTTPAWVKADPTERAEVAFAAVAVGSDSPRNDTGHDQ
jgi:hypothetical protein